MVRPEIGCTSPALPRRSARLLSGTLSAIRVASPPVTIFHAQPSPVGRFHWRVIGFSVRPFTSKRRKSVNEPNFRSGYKQWAKLLNSICPMRLASVTVSRKWWTVWVAVAVQLQGLRSRCAWPVNACSNAVNANRLSPKINRKRRAHPVWSAIPRNRLSFDRVNSARSHALRRRVGELGCGGANDVCERTAFSV